MSTTLLVLRRYFVNSDSKAEQCKASCKHDYHKHDSLPPPYSDPRNSEDRKPTEDSEISRDSGSEARERDLTTLASLGVVYGTWPGWPKTKELIKVLYGKDRVAAWELRADISKQGDIVRERRRESRRFIEAYIMYRLEGPLVRIKARLSVFGFLDYYKLLNQSQEHVADVEAGRRGELCGLHNTKECYCVAFPYKGETMRIDLKGG
jgi:hypothetical protein